MPVHAATIGDLKAVETPAVVYRPGRLGPVELNEVAFPSDWSVATDDVGDGYYLHLPLTGRFRSRHAGLDLTPDRLRTALYQPGAGAFQAWWDGGYRGVCVVLNATAVRDALHRLLQDGPESWTADRHGADLVMEPLLDIGSIHGRSWAALAVSLRQQMNGAGDLFAHPMVAAPLAESLLNGFLLTASHRHLHILHTPVRTVAPATIRAAVELIHADPQAPLTVAALARHGGVGVRALQNGFRRYLGLSPLAYVRDVRLGRAHNDLLAGDPPSPPSRRSHTAGGSPT